MENVTTLEAAWINDSVLARLVIDNETLEKYIVFSNSDQEPKIQLKLDKYDIAVIRRKLGQWTL